MKYKYFLDGNEFPLSAHADCERIYQNMASHPMSASDLNELRELYKREWQKLVDDQGKGYEEGF